MPRMLRDIVENAVRLEPDMELVESTEDRNLSMNIKTGRVDVAIVANRNQGREHAQLLLENHQLTLLILTGDGREAHFLQLHETPVAEVSPPGLMAGIRAVAGGGILARAGPESRS